MFNQFWEGLIDLILPRLPECPLCGRTGRHEGLCPVCREQLDMYWREPTCARCGRFLLPYPGASEVVSELCPECSAGGGWPFTAVRAVGPHEGVLREAVQRLKYGNNRWLAGPLAGLMAEVYHREECFRAAEIILPVPLTGKKLRQRGYNQAELLAGELGKLIKLPVLTGVLTKIFDTPSQAGLSRPEREDNLVGAFKLVNSSAVAGKIITVIDDVFTTGSTISAAARALAAGGARETVGLTLTTGRYK
ncbi:ComF family protein [Desulfolucanica intricata]|uniref:ComF family protein n=1 Tax=Desulfolucanica intricata TaxID=1285191 RepID=UPI00082E7FD6|nr:ComF family protein [Desulfolucanica intricata]